jgi:predicted transcriptional regulator
MAARLGTVARRAREDAGITLMDVAVTAGVGQTSIHRFELGDGWRRETDAIVDAYAQLCQTTPQALWQAALDAPGP